MKIDWIPLSFLRKFPLARLIRPLATLRTKNHVNTRLAIRDEAVFYKRTLPLSAGVYILFGVLDGFVAPDWPVIRFLILRMIAVMISCLAFLALRGRANYSTRAFLTAFPVTFCVIFIAAKFNLINTPYFTGPFLVIIAVFLQFQVKFTRALLLNFLLLSPLFIWMFLMSNFSIQELILGTTMGIGSVVITSTLCETLHSEITSKFAIQERIARESGRRHKIIDEKVAELFKKRTLEHQFSPQILNQVMSQPADVLNMRSRSITMLVLDVENSTGKSVALNPNDYKTVIEDAFDLFSSVCLKWNLTLDKFTGDGAQAFAGAPLTRVDDRFRAIQAGLDFLRMLKAKQSTLAALWGENLRVRLAIVSGVALVGFVGRGRIRSFTAIGETVSLAHRICSIGTVDNVCVLNNTAETVFQINGAKIGEARIIKDLKGFGSKKFHVTEYQINETSQESIDLGRCKNCNTPLVLNTDTRGITDIKCPACSSSENNEEDKKEIA